MEVNDSVGKTEVFLQFNGTGAAKVRDAIATGTRNIVTDHPVFGCLNTGIIEQYKQNGLLERRPTHV